MSAISKTSVGIFSYLLTNILSPPHSSGPEPLDTGSGSASSVTPKFSVLIVTVASRPPSDWDLYLYVIFPYHSVMF